jgi:hypothetical protein
MLLRATLSSRLVGILLLVDFTERAAGWIPLRTFANHRHSTKSRTTNTFHLRVARVDLESLMEMDVVIYSEISDEEKTKRLGAIQEDGRITPLSAWTEEPAFGDSVEFVVAEADLFPGFQRDGRITVHAIVPEYFVSYGSRQLFGGKGPGNPHGEESELLYYVDRRILQGVEVTVKPELEIIW